MKKEKSQNNTPNWLILVHHFPKKPGSLRMKIWRRLQGIGAIPIKNALYVLPLSEQTREDFEWILKEIISGGAEGAILEAQFVKGMDDNQIKRLFNEARDQDFETLAGEISSVQSDLADELNPQSELFLNMESQILRFRKRLWEIDNIDFFGANGREAAEGLIDKLSDIVAGQVEEKEQEMESELDKMQGKIWVTRENIHVDRIASAWLVANWIDPDARFKFTANKQYQPEAGEVRFDMFEAEYTHEGDKCTFETLLKKAGINDPALIRIGQIIHDIDLKDGKYGHEETAGISLMLQGLSASIVDDFERLQKGSEIFENLRQVFIARKL